MNYKRLSIEELNRYPYPNLIAEIIESGYSTSTLADFMGLGSKKNGKYRPEGDPEVWDKLTGKSEIVLAEAAGLARYYGREFSYLFSHDLAVMSNEPLEYWHWYEENRQKQEKIEQSKAIMEIYEELVAKPYLLDFMKVCITLNEEQRARVLQMLEEKATA